MRETEGLTMYQGGSPIKAWYSSTHGGYVFSSGEIGWSGTSWTKHANDFDGSIGSFADLSSRAYDRDSPWFYCDWGSRGEYNKTAWLKSDELADIVNIILLVKNDPSTRDHLYQVDKSNPAGTDTWDFEKVKSELRSRGINPFSSISDALDQAEVLLLIFPATEETLLFLPRSLKTGLICAHLQIFKSSARCLMLKKDDKLEYDG